MITEVFECNTKKQVEFAILDLIEQDKLHYTKHFICTPEFAATWDGTVTAADEGIIKFLLTYELLPLTNIKDYETLKGVIDAQSTTNMLNALAYSLNPPYKPTPATSIKYCLTGHGKASKEEMCQAAYTITGDEELLKNDHMADAFADCFYAFIQRLKKDCAYYNTPVPEKWAKFDWNFKVMPKAPWEK